MSTFHHLSIKNIITETANAVSVVFDVPKNLQSNFSFTAGQYITLKTTINGNEIRRAYSICSSPESGVLKVAIKAVENGIFSNYATSQLKIGDILEVHEPEGKFIIQPSKCLNYIGFAAGSGITPILSMIKSVLVQEPTASFTLIYGNKTVEETIFKSELDALKIAYSSRFNLHYVLSRETTEESFHGRIDQSLTDYFINNRYKNWTFDTAYLCGPEQMIHTVSSTLQDCNFKESQILFELFSVSVDEKVASKIKNDESHVTVLLDDEEFSFTMKQTDNLLSASLRNDIDAPYSCQGGVCSSCLAKVTLGNAIMAKNTILSDQEVNDGFILTCQAHPTTPEISIDFDDI